MTIDHGSVDSAVSFTEEESSALRDALSSYCSDLRMEIADTDNPGYRRQLRHERELLESVLSKLHAGARQSDERDEAGRVVVRMISIWSAT
jgi:hypothetical protein